MKICQTCKQTYTDDNLNFCLNDGGVLTNYDDAPPTVAFNQARTTQPNWQNFEPVTPWQNQPLQTNQSSPLQPNQSSYPAQYQSPNQTLPTVSLVLGILAILLTCCWGGFPLGLAAVITGYIGLQNTNNNSQLYSGRGLAIGGMATGAVALLFGVGMIILAILGNL